jgi:uncharacterized protein with NAD-binding domain and iron-sulfur cluster
MFQYRGGDRTKPSYGAGTAIQVVLRALGTYEGAPVWEMRAGMGDVVVAPLFEVLKARGVHFRFFHKLTKIELTTTKRAIKGLRFARQAELVGDRKEYDPTIVCGDLLCWPSEPRWEQIKNSKRLRRFNLESYWCSTQAGPEVRLEQGKKGPRGFDDVILAIPLGAFKRLNAAEGPCDALIRSDNRFRAMTENLNLVPSISVQAWLRKDLKGLGWQEPRPAMVSGPPPLDIWADMSDVLTYEGWDAKGKPLSLHYFCGVLASELYRRPPRQTSTPKEADRRAGQEAEKWFEDNDGVRRLWPDFTTRMFAAGKAKGCKGWTAHANVDPAHCCVGTTAGSSAWRLKTDASGFKHLYLTGAWIDTGFNTECVEAAVMSGMQAARAICGRPRAVPGESFLHNRYGSDLVEIFAEIISLVPDGDGLASPLPLSGAD